jgi:alpha-L-rhamnosidase
MKFKTYLLLTRIALYAMLGLNSCDTRLAVLQVDYLRCEYLVNPMGIDVPSPRLSWVLSSEERNQVQTAYQVLVASTMDALTRNVGDFWDSGKTPSDESTQVNYAGNLLPSGIQVYWKVRIWDKNGKPSAWSAPAAWSMGILDASDWKAKWIEAPIKTLNAILPSRMKGPELRSATLLQKQFTVDGTIKRAVAYISALGVYEFHLNGHRVGDHILAPEWTDCNKRIQYQTYDVTSLITSGNNAAGAIISDGWYVGMYTLPRKTRKFLAQIEIELANGQLKTIITDESWRMNSDGAILHSDIYDGELYDARKEVPGWDVATFDASGWQPAHIGSQVSARMVAQPNEPIRVTDELKPVSLTEPTPGVYIFDLGQNFAGWCRFHFQATSGTTITMRHGEALNEDGTLFTANLNCGWRRKDGALQTERYTFRSNEPEIFEPHFTYHGFRYVEVTGLPARPSIDAVVGRVFHSSAPEVGSFECSSSLLNKLMHNILWTQRSNLMGIPTDCPQRDERLGWLGDIQVYSQTACFNMDMAGFFTKFIADMRDSQDNEGRYSIYAPRLTGQGGAPAWADAGVILPWRMYQNYGDTRVLREHFESARRWVDWVHSRNPDLIWRNDRGDDFGDWLNTDTFILPGMLNWPKTGGAVPNDVFATAFFAYSTEILARMAAVLGRKEDAAAYMQQALDIKAAFNRAFVKPDGMIKGDTQAGYALALSFNILPDSLTQPAAAHMLANIARYKGHPSTGIQGTNRLMLELSRMGYNDVAYQIITTRTFPSWGYEIDQGATTIWERWDGYVSGRGYLYSLNHYAIGSVGEWIWRNVVGINPDDNQPGYKHIIIHPRPGGGLTWARGQYNSIHGPIVCGWKVSNTGYEMEVSIPANTTATVYIPAQNIGNITERGKPALNAGGVKYLRMDKSFAVVEVGSGSYMFRSL